MQPLPTVDTLAPGARTSRRPWHGSPTLSLFRIWMIGSVVVFGGLFVYAYVPLLIPLGVIALGLAVLVGGIVWLTRRFRRPEPEDAP